MHSYFAIIMPIKFASRVCFPRLSYTEFIIRARACNERENYSLFFMVECYFVLSRKIFHNNYDAVWARNLYRHSHSV